MGRAHQYTELGLERGVRVLKGEESDRGFLRMGGDGARDLRSGAGGRSVVTDVGARK